MKTLLRILDWCKLHIILFIAFISAALFIFVSETFTVSFPVEYLQKIPFGILGSAMILWSAFLWIKYGRPKAWDTLDHKTDGGIESITDWQKVLVSLYWIFLFAFIAALLAFAL